MNAKNSDEARIRALYDAIQELRYRVNETEMTAEKFKNPEGAVMRTLVDGLVFCAYSITEEATNLSDEIKNAYDIVPWHKIRGFRNRLSHAYGEIDHEQVWDAIVYDFPHLEQVCISYAQDIHADLPEKVVLKAVL